MANADTSEEEACDIDLGMVGLEYLNTFDSYPTKTATFTLVREGLVKAEFTSECRAKDIETVEATLDDWIRDQVFETTLGKCGFIARKFGPPAFPENAGVVEVEFMYYIEPTLFPSD